MAMAFKAADPVAVRLALQQWISPPRTDGELDRTRKRVERDPATISGNVYVEKRCVTRGETRPRRRGVVTWVTKKKQKGRNLKLEE